MSTRIVLALSAIVPTAPTSFVFFLSAGKAAGARRTVVVTDMTPVG